MDSSFADSMKAQVFTTKISASPGSVVSSIPPSCKIPSMTSVSTKFFAHPKLIIPAFIYVPPLDPITKKPPLI